MDDDDRDIYGSILLEHEEQSTATTKLLKKANQWYWKNGGKWELYDVFLNVAIQNAFAKKTKEYQFTLPDKGTYVILFDRMLQINEVSGVSRKIKCDDVDNRDKITLKLDYDDNAPSPTATPRSTQHNNSQDTKPHIVAKVVATIPTKPPLLSLVGLSISTSPTKVDLSIKSPLAKSAPQQRHAPVINQWHWDNNGTWEPYDSLTNIAIQNSYATNKKKICDDSTQWQL